MTAREWLNLPPGRELDAVVAERIMGVDAERIVTDTFDPLNRLVQLDDHLAPLPHYSTRIEDAWKVVDEMGTGLKLQQTGPDNEWHCSIGYWRTVWAKTAPHAICLAALTAVEVTE